MERISSIHFPAQIVHIDMNKYKNANQKTTLEIKAKIGALIREFNVSNIKEFQTDLKQQTEIDILKNGLKVNAE